jgi:hypothetical protein
MYVFYVFPFVSSLLRSAHLKFKDLWTEDETETEMSSPHQGIHLFSCYAACDLICSIQKHRKAN